MITPKTEDEVSEFLVNTTKSVRIVGGGTRQGLGNYVGPEVKLSTLGLTGITLLEPAALTLVVRAGTPLAEVQGALAAENQQLPFEPMDHTSLLGTQGVSTIGGVVACNISGSRRIQAGACRDSLIGVRFVDGMGTIVKNGGRVMKNVTGYDLSKLVTGSFGTLVALTEITLKVLPKKKSSNTITINTDDKKLVNELFEKISSSSSEVSGAVYVPEEPKDESYDHNKEMVFKFNDLENKGSFVALRIDGDKISIDEKIKALTDELELNKLNTTILDVHQSTPFWIKINNLELFTQTKNNLLRVVIPPSQGKKLMQYLGNKYKYYIDWCGSLYWIEVQSKKNTKVGEIKNLIKELGGYLTVIKTSNEYDYEETIFTVDDTRLLISEKIKKSFDPKRIFNPGKMYRGI